MEFSGSGKVSAIEDETLFVYNFYNDLRYELF